MDSTPTFRFEIALSFPGTHRARVKRIATLLAHDLSKDKVLFDEWNRGEFARPKLNVYLPTLYGEQSRLMVTFLCADYEGSEWCGLEWRYALEMIKQKRDSQLMLLRLDHADIPGLTTGDGYLDITTLADEEVSWEILKRLDQVRRSPSPAHVSTQSPATRPYYRWWNSLLALWLVTAALVCCVLAWVLFKSRADLGSFVQFLLLKPTVTLCAFLFIATGMSLLLCHWHTLTRAGILVVTIGALSMYMFAVASSQRLTSHGFVKAGLAGPAIADADVHLINNEGHTLETTTTDSGGNFFLHVSTARDDIPMLSGLHILIVKPNLGQLEAPYHAWKEIGGYYLYPKQ